MADNLAAEVQVHMISNAVKCDWSTLKGNWL